MLKAPESYFNYMQRLYSNEKKANGDIKNILNFTFQVTEDCNLRCPYCYEPKKYHNYMTFDTAKKAIDYIFNTAVYEPDSIFSYDRNMGIVFDFIGGEPLLAIDLITNILDYTEEIMFKTNSPYLTKHKYSFSTNGTIYFDDRVQALLKKYGPHLISMSVTVDGNKELHDTCRKFVDGSGSYDLAIAAALDQKDNYGNNGTKITLSPYNIDKMVPAVANMLSLGFPYITINVVNEYVWNYDLGTLYYYKIKELADYILDNNLEESCYIMIFDDSIFTPYKDIDNRPNSCGGTGGMVALDYQGLFYPCFRYMKNCLNGEQPPLIIGNIDRGIYKTDEEKKILEEFEKVTTISQSTEECLSCPIAEGCCWCSAYNYQCFGTVNKRTTAICPMHKARALGNLYFWSKYALKSKKSNSFQNHINEKIALEIIPKEEWNKLLKLYEEVKDNGL